MKYLGKLKFMMKASFLFFFLVNSCLADMQVRGLKVIDKTTTFENVQIDLSHGHFIVNKNSALSIKKSVINVTISPDNPFFVFLQNGTLTLEDNTINVTVEGISPNPLIQSLYYLIRIQQGQVNISKNTFHVNQTYSVGVLITDKKYLTSLFTINNNTIKNFHGGLYLINSDNLTVNNNTFTNVSFSNIFYMGRGSTFTQNVIKFPGNFNVGDGIDIINSSNTSLFKNIISSGASYGIAIIGSQHLTLDSNRITDNKSYGIYIATASPSTVRANKILSILTANYTLKNIPNSNIKIANNYFAQNRFGLAGNNTDGLDVKNNIFIQSFTNSKSRQFWTNNQVLLAGIDNLTWAGNLYKEAYSQHVPGDDSLSSMFVPFPTTGGVVF